MNPSSDTIAAIATAPGSAALGIVRVSGPDARRVAASVIVGGDGWRWCPRRVSVARVMGREGVVVDEALVVFFEGPRSATAEDVVEFSLHGSPAILRSVLGALVGAGARLARPGEFTLRAFLGGRIDLVQAEGVLALVSSESPVLAAAACDQVLGGASDRIAAIERRLFDVVVRLEASVDFPEEDYHFISGQDVDVALVGCLDGLRTLVEDVARGDVARVGATVVIVGEPNVGKSSVFNRLVGGPRSIVTPVPGTTRDLVSERVSVDGVPLRLVDTAGIRESADEVEREGVERARRAGAGADAVLVVCDGSVAPDVMSRRLLEERGGQRGVIVVNKADRGLHVAWQDLVSGAPAGTVAVVSALDGSGFDQLRGVLLGVLDGDVGVRDSVVMLSARQSEVLRAAVGALESCVDRRLERHGGGGQVGDEELVLADLYRVRDCLDDVCGRRGRGDVLDEVFSRFCIGK